MDKRIENSAICEVRSVIRFLNAKNIKPVDIHRQICEVYVMSIGDVVSDSMVRRWVRLFNEGRTNVHDERTGRPSLVNDVLVQEVEKNFLQILHGNNLMIRPTVQIWHPVIFIFSYT